MKLFKEIETKYYKLQNLKDVNFIYGRMNSGKTNLLGDIYHDFDYSWYNEVKNKYTYTNPIYNEMSVKHIHALLLDNNLVNNDDTNRFSKMFPVIPTFDDNYYAFKRMRHIDGKCNYQHLIRTINTNFKDCGIEVKLTPKNFNGCIWPVYGEKKIFSSGANANEFKILYLFSVLSVFKLAGPNVIFMDEFLDSFDVETQDKIINTMVKFSPHTQFFIITNNPNMYENISNFESSNNIRDLEKKRLNEKVLNI